MTGNPDPHLSKIIKQSKQLVVTHMMAFKLSAIVGKYKNRK